MKKITIFLIFGFLLHYSNTQTFSDVTEGVENVATVVTSVKSIIDVIIDAIDSSSRKRNEQLINSKLDALAQQIVTLDREIKNSLDDVVRSITDAVKFETKLREFEDIRDKIVVRFKGVLDITERHTFLSNETLLAKSSEILYGSESISNLLEQLSKKLFDNNLVDILFKNMKQSREANNPAQVLLHKFYISLVTLNMKGFAMQIVAYRLKNKLENFQSSSEEGFALKTFYWHIKKINTEFVKLVNRADRFIWKSDPQEHILYKTYDKLTRFNQLYFAMEESFANRCMFECKDYPTYKSENPYKVKSDYLTPNQRKCNGVLSNCYPAAQPYMTCYGLKIWLPRSTQSDRIYEYVEGNEDTCPKYGKKPKNRPFDIEQVSDLAGAYWCDICRCTCDDPDDPKTDRYFSLAEIRSSTELNMVVTGVRFIKQDQIFHLQIQEARLMPSGTIDNLSRRWKSLPKIHKHDPMNVYTLSVNNSHISVGVVEKPDGDYVVTGLKFSRNGDNLNLNVIYEKFEPATGQLLKHTEITNAMLTNNHEFDLVDRDIPINYHNNVPTSQNSGVVYFTSTGMKDLKQSTVPFIDVQAVESSLMALSGIGLHLKINGWSGGFIAPKLETFPVQMSNMFNEDISSLQKILSPQDNSSGGASYLCLSLTFLPLMIFVKVLF